MPVAGNAASFKFATTAYTQADCLSGWSLNDQINDIVYQCGGFDKHLAGTRSANFSISMALDATDHALLNTLKVGTTGAWEGHPAGDTATYTEIVAAVALITQSNISAPMNGIVTVDLTIALDDITYQAASS